MVHNPDLLGKKLDLPAIISKPGVRRIELFLHRNELILEGRDQDYKRFPVKVIQVFLGKPGHKTGPRFFSGPIVPK